MLPRLRSLVKKVVKQDPKQEVEQEVKQEISKNDYFGSTFFSEDIIKLIARLLDIPSMIKFSQTSKKINHAVENTTISYNFSNHNDMSSNEKLKHNDAFTVTATYSTIRNALNQIIPKEKSIQTLRKQNSRLLSDNPPSSEFGSLIKSIYMLGLLEFAPSTINGYDKRTKEIRQLSDELEVVKTSLKKR